MNKVQLIQRVAKDARVKKSQASRSVKALVKTIRDALRVGDKVSLSGLGTFKVKSRKARKDCAISGVCLPISATRLNAVFIARF